MIFFYFVNLHFEIYIEPCDYRNPCWQTSLIKGCLVIVQHHVEIYMFKEKQAFAKSAPL